MKATAYKKVDERHSWTKSEIKKLAKLWSTMNTEQLAESIGVEVKQVGYMADMIRKEFPEMLPKKHKKGVLRGLIREALG